MNTLNLAGLKTWLTDDDNVLETMAAQRRDETTADALPIMVGLFAVGLAMGTLGAMFLADATTNKGQSTGTKGQAKNAKKACCRNEN